MPRTGPSVGENGTLHMRWAIRVDTRNLESSLSSGNQGAEAGVALCTVTSSDQLQGNFPHPYIPGLCEFKAFPKRKHFHLGKSKNFIEL